MSLAMRDAFGKKLAELGAVYPELVVLDADVSSSTKSNIFAEKYPDRFFNCGVAEANMAGVAAGLATCGLRPVINAFSIFLSLKATDQIRNDICYNNLPVIIAGSYGGLSDSYDGASHQSITDIAIMRALPNMQVIVPADSNQAELALEYALQQKGPVFIRINRNALPELPGKKDFTEKKVIKCTTGTDITIAANGITASFAMEAFETLKKQGIHAEVFSVPFVKPLDIKPIAASIKKTGKLLCIEEHVLKGGFTGAVCEELMKKKITCEFDAIGIEDTFTETGDYFKLLAAYGLSAGNVVKRVKKLCKNH
ncbi:transketolase family protein [Treponema socranskii]|uniref:Transketolase, pyridine binding domain protein n=1 Tax=Treponema socranskii subsp. socranskii VPI DR56BR1116 = ATCC 35536 TaxID=1125725 RepID=A0ABP2YMV4_TRESO|nr:transketolase C-terminal domain-containing protein [Treponema socranskii]ERK04385.1 transketolase, pyridine binding domain protein [Treponema socranskii subsp. socranskii VPI DR56BR1116 = ATCC 35536]MDR9860175.1 transketolase C-terminal domain-containing protein [Treponema socranskii]